jgi:RNA polymerase sigma-70 factor (ECF subfamily)
MQRPLEQAWTILKPRAPMATDEFQPRAKNPDEVVDLFSDEVWRFVSSQILRREDAEDVVMEVFAAAFKNFPNIAGAQDQRLWLLGVARRKVADCLRLRYRRAEQPLSPEQTIEDSEPDGLHIAAQSALQKLPQEQGEVLVLKYINGLSTDEVARVIRRSLPATNSLLQRARGALREALGPVFAEFARSES